MLTALVRPVLHCTEWQSVSAPCCFAVNFAQDARAVLGVDVLVSADAPFVTSTNKYVPARNLKFVRLGFMHVTRTPTHMQAAVSISPRWAAWSVCVSQTLQID